MPRFNSTLLRIFCMACLLYCAGCVRNTSVLMPQEQNAFLQEKKLTSKPTVSVKPRKLEFTINESLDFIVTITNNTNQEVIVPFLYDAIIEIDGYEYTLFPKPRVIGNDGKVISGECVMPHASTTRTLTIGSSGLKLYDSKTGSKVLNLVPGKHVLTLNVSSIKSEPVSFNIIN